jgi:REP element-mobilizing transposase RayT
MALAYFITFTTYGTWLHGSSRGQGSVDMRHNTFGAPYIAPSEEREKKAREARLQPAYVMTAREREVVCRAIVELSQARRWNLLAVHVRSNHVHVVVCADLDPGRMMSDMKARASRELTASGFGDAKRKRWTRHGSTLHLFRESEVAAKIHYTLDEQGERMAWYAQEPRTYEPRTQ